MIAIRVVRHIAVHDGQCLVVREADWVLVLVTAASRSVGDKVSSGHNAQSGRYVEAALQITEPPLYASKLFKLLLESHPPQLHLPQRGLIRWIGVQQIL